jgi:hypothetical protein
VVSPGKNIHTQNAFMADTFGFYAAAQRCALAAVGGRGLAVETGKAQSQEKAQKTRRVPTFSCTSKTVFKATCEAGLCWSGIGVL